MNAFEQCVNDLVDLDPEAELRDLALDGERREQLGVGDDRRARPFTRSVSPTPGTRKRSPTWGFAMMLRSESARRFPGRSGTRRVRSSTTRTNPGGSPRGLTSQLPSGADVASSMNGESSMNRRVRSLTRSLTLERTRSAGSPIRSRNACSLVIGADTTPIMPRLAGRAEQKLRKSLTEAPHARNIAAIP